MFDKNFYPTPKAVISKMIEGINLSDQLILEPSAGKGDILDFILDRLLEKCPSYLNKDNIKPDLLDNFYCIEKNPDLQNVLRGKGKPSIHYSTREKLLDIEKALCFVSGKKFTDIKSNTIDSVVNRKKDKDLTFGNWYDSEFFKFKIFKKGTLHLEFKDKFLYEQFNIIACKGKNWLPDTYGHSTTQGKAKAHPKAKAYSFSENNNKSTTGEFCNSLTKASVFQLSIIDSQI